MNRNIAILMMVAGALACAGAASAETIRKTDGKELTGNRIKWFETRKEYQIEKDDGSMIPVPLDEVESVEVAKPPEFDQAVKSLAARQYDAAIPVLEDIVSRYRRLQWDAKARELLANACMAKQDYKKAVQVMGDLMANTSKNQITDDQKGLYWSALMGAQMMSALKKELNDALAGDSKSLAALAMVKRGDVFKSEGKREDAVLDYMRAVLLFEEEHAVHPEALFKAAQVLDEMRDPRADAVRKQLMMKYPDSAYARKTGV